MAEKTTVADKTTTARESEPAAGIGTVANLGNANLKDCRAASAAMGSKCDANLTQMSITNDSHVGTGAIDITDSKAATPHLTGGMVVAKETLERSSAAIKNTENYLTAADTSAEDKLKSAGVLAANGIKELKGADGKEYRFDIDKDKTVHLKTTDVSGHVSEASGKLSADGSEVLKSGGLENASDTNGTKKENGAYDTSPVPKLGDHQSPDAPPKPTGKDALFDPAASQEDKLKAARDMADHGQKRFKGPDGKDYEIGTQKYGNREAVTIFQSDGKGHAHVMMRGIVDDKGHVTQQHDSKGKAVDIEGDWAKKNGADNALLRHDEPKRDKPNEGDRGKLEGTPEEQKQLDASRERLKRDANSNIENPQDRDKFTKDMDALEQRAKTQPLSAKEVSDTYDQLSKLLEAHDGAVGKPERVLAAETFAHHMGEPTNIDQGQHNTCNVTTLEEHLITRNPSKAAEIVTTMATAGHWTAPDGKDIKITPGSLVPGAEEKNNPPNDGDRSYATQLLNLALVNDRDQRKIPPEFYSQERPSGQGDTGERLKYADGTSVTKNDVMHNGDQTPYNSPNLRCNEISREGESINGEGKFVIANSSVDTGEGVVHVSSADDLRRSLSEMKAGNKFPAVIMVDANTAAFGGNPAQGPGWHVVSVTGYDDATGKVHISNQWGKAADRDMSLNDLYRSTYTK